MKELIDPQQAQHLMLGILILAPLAGLIAGAISKKLLRGFLIGLLIGGGNFLLWTIYNAITDRLGLDTVRNLLVNLALFALVGLAAGWAAAKYQARSQNANEEK